MYIGMYGCSAQASGRYCARAVVDLNRGFNKDICGFTTSCCAGEAARCVKSRKGKGKGRVVIRWYVLLTSHLCAYRLAIFTDRDIAAVERDCPGSRAAMGGTCEA